MPPRDFSGLLTGLLLLTLLASLGWSLRLQRRLRSCQTALAQEIDQHRQATQRGQRLDELYTILNQCNDAIVRGTDQHQLLQQICHNAVGLSRINMAWIGLISESDRQIQIAAAHGAGLSYLDDLRISLDPDDPSGRGPTGIAIREDRPVWCQDYQHDSTTAPWHERASRSDWASSASLPLHRSGQVIGALNLYADRPQAFDEAAQQLLRKMVANLDFALDHLAAMQASEQSSRFQRQLLAKYEANLSELNHQKFAIDQHAIVTITDPAGDITYANDKFCAISGYRREELLGRNHRLINSGQEPPALFEDIWATLKRGEVWHGELCNRNKAGQLYWVDSTIVPLLNAKGEPERHIAIRTDITRIKRIEQSLKEAKQAAEAANLAKSAFLANMSHEIRTPLNAMLGLAQVLQRGELDQQQRDLVHRLRVAGDLLLHNLNDILDFSKIEAGQMTLEQRPFQLSQLMENMKGLVDSTARAKGLTLSMDAPDLGDWQLIGDALRVSQILLNLTSNAIKFTSRGSVAVRVILLERHDSRCRLRFEVSDTGIGIAADKLPTLFQPFTQADNSVMRRFGGTGLGLSICKRLTKLMGGTIGVDSQEHRNSCFWFELPFEMDQSQAGDGSEPPAQATTATMTGKRLAGCHVLVVDDSEMNLYTAKQMLTLEGATTTLAMNGRQALDLLMLQPDGFDAVLMDMQMPVLNGLDAIGVLRHQLGLDKLPVVVCSAGALSEDRQRALAVGANDFMSKPIELELMVATLSRWMGQADAAPAVAPQASGPGNESSPEASGWPEIDGIDVARMREEFHGDKEFFLTLLDMLAHQLDLTRQQLPLELAQGQPDRAAERLHKLRGAAGSIGAGQLVQACQQLEDAVRANDPELEAQLRQFESGVATLQQACAPWRLAPKDLHPRRLSDLSPSGVG